MVLFIIPQEFYNRHIYSAVLLHRYALTAETVRHLNRIARSLSTIQPSKGTVYSTEHCYERTLATTLFAATLIFANLRPMS